MPRPPSGLRVELEDAQLLVAAAGLRDARGPRDGLFARGQFEHGETAVERGRTHLETSTARAVERGKLTPEGAAELLGCARGLEIEGDDLIVEGSGGAPIAGGYTIDPKGDHRICMAYAVAGLHAALAVEVAGMEIADTSADGRIVSMLEGGYDLQGLARSAAAHVTALMRG